MKNGKTKMKKTSNCKCKKNETFTNANEKKEEKKVKEPIYIVICKKDY